MDFNEGYLEQFCTTDEKKPLLIQFTKTFIQQAKDGKMQAFSYSESQKVPVLKHDPERIRVYRQFPKTSILDLPNGESFDQSVADKDTLSALKQNLLGKPFLVRTPLKAERKTYTNKEVKGDEFKTNVMVLFNPEYCEISKSIVEAFNSAEEKMEKKEKFSMQLNLTQNIWVWYTDLLQKATNDTWEITSSPTAVFTISSKSKGITGFLKSAAFDYFTVNGDVGFTKEPMQF